MGRDRDTRMPRSSGSPEARMSPERSRDNKRFVGNAAAVVGILFAVGGLIYSLAGGGANVSAAVVGAALGILGYFLGSRRLGTTAVILCVAVLFFGLAASQGLIPGVEGVDRPLPDEDPRTGG